MLVRIHADDVKDSGLRGVVDSKKVTFYMIVVVDDSNIDFAIDKFSRYNSVVAFEYVGNVDLLRGKELGSKPVYVTRQTEDLGMGVDFIVPQLPLGLRCLLEVPSDFADMREVEKVCNKYDNVYVTGGNFINLPTVRLGAISEVDLPKKIVESKVPVTLQGVTNIMQTVNFEDVTDVEFFTAKVKVEKKEKVPKVKIQRTPKVKAEKAPKEKVQKPKKQLATLLSLVGSTANEDNF